jgi:hypothetical protein
LSYNNVSFTILTIAITAAVNVALAILVHIDVIVITTLFMSLVVTKATIVLATYECYTRKCNTKCRCNGYTTPKVFHDVILGSTIGTDDSPLSLLILARLDSQYSGALSRLRLPLVAARNMYAL